MGSVREVRRHPRSLFWRISLVAVVAGCAGNDKDADVGNVAIAPDSSAANQTAPLISPIPIERNSDAHVTGTSIDPPSKDDDQHFLRDMIDHHESLVYLSHQVLQRITGGPIKDEFSGFDIAQDAEKQSMLAILKSDYWDNHQATAQSSEVAIADSIVGRASHNDFERLKNKFIAEHHRRGLAMIDSALPSLTRPAVRKLAQDMRNQMRRELLTYSAKKPRK